MQEKHNSSALALELRFSCTNQSSWSANKLNNPTIAYNTLQPYLKLAEYVCLIKF